MAGDALDLRVLDGLDDDVVAEPVDADLANICRTTATMRTILIA
jgi:hypothetical protein